MCGMTKNAPIYSADNLIPVKEISNYILDPDAITKYLKSLTADEFFVQYERLDSIASSYDRGSLEDRACNVVGKNIWQSELLGTVFGSNQNQMAEFIGSYGFKLSLIYCSLNCPNPCKTGGENAKKLLPIYSSHVKDSEEKYLLGNINSLF